MIINVQTTVFIYYGCHINSNLKLFSSKDQTEQDLSKSVMSWLKKRRRYFNKTLQLKSVKLYISNHWKVLSNKTSNKSDCERKVRSQMEASSNNPLLQDILSGRKGIGSLIKVNCMGLWRIGCCKTLLQVQAVKVSTSLTFQMAFSSPMYWVKNELATVLQQLPCLKLLNTL